MEENKEEKGDEKNPNGSVSVAAEKKDLIALPWIIAAVLFVLVLAFGFMTFEGERKNAEFKKSIDALEEGKKDLEAKLSSFQRGLPPSQGGVANSAPENGANAENLLRVTSPNGGESLCLENPLEISWTAPSDLETVIVSLDTSVSFNRLGEFPAVTGVENGVGIGKKVWNMQNERGYAIPESDVYKISLSADYRGQHLSAKSDRIFSIKKCQPNSTSSATGEATGSVQICAKNNSCKSRSVGSEFRCTASSTYSANGDYWCRCDADCNAVKR